MAFLINGKNPIPPGPPGLSPYQVAAAGGYTGTEAEFNAALADIGGPQDAADPNGSLYARVNSLFTSVSEGKAKIAAAVTGKGVQTAADESFTNMAGKIGQIQSGGTGILREVPLEQIWTGKSFGYACFIYESCNLALVPMGASGGRTSGGYIGVDAFPDGVPEMSEEFPLLMGYNFYGRDDCLEVVDMSGNVIFKVNGNTGAVVIDRAGWTVKFYAMVM